MANCQEGCAANGLEEQQLAVGKGESEKLCLLHRACRVFAEGAVCCLRGLAQWLVGLAGPSCVEVWWLGWMGWILNWQQC